MSRAAALLLAAVLAGCSRVNLRAEEPALLTGGERSLAVVAEALRRALGQPVALAPDALTRDSQLVIEPVPARAGGQRIDGRETRPTERFTLLRQGGRCMLRRENTGERLALPGAQCRVP